MAKGFNTVAKAFERLEAEEAAKHPDPEPKPKSARDILEEHWDEHSKIDPYAELNIAWATVRTMRIKYNNLGIKYNDLLKRYNDLVVRSSDTKV